MIGVGGRIKAAAAGLAMVLTGATLLSAGPAANAADLTPATPAPAPVDPSPGEWRFQATAYGWATGIKGDVGIRNLPATGVDLPFSKVLANLDGGLMGSFYATNGEWLVLTDLVLARLSHSFQIPALGASTLDVGLNQTVATGAIGYMLPLTQPGLEVAVTGGLRYMRLKADVALSPAFLPASLTVSQSQGWLDPTIGLFAHWRIDDRWFVNAIVDIGGFGLGSEVSSTGYLGLGYMWNRSFSTGLGFRYLYEDYEGPGARKGTFRYNATSYGPTLSMAWHF